MKKKTFFRVKEKYDHTQFWKSNDNQHFEPTICILGRELLTEKQVRKHCIPLQMLDKIECFESETYRAFGARFLIIDEAEH